MQASVQPYIFLGGQCEEAINYYVKHLGATSCMMMRYKESPEPPKAGCELPSNWSEKIMHAAFKIGSSTLMVSDGMEESRERGKFCLSLALPDEAEANRAFVALADGGSVFMPLGKTFWSPCFGMCTDRFGISWMVTLAELA